MDDKFFFNQIGRLKDVFGEKNYPAERTAIFWKEMQDFSNHWFKEVVDDLIATERYAPLLNQFREKIALERERGVFRDKKEQTKDAKEFASFFQTEDIHSVVENTCNKLTGQMQALDFTSMVKSLSKVTSTMNPYKCNDCFDTGVRDARNDEPIGAIVCECRSRKPVLIKKVY